MSQSVEEWVVSWAVPFHVFVREIFRFFGQPGSKNVFYVYDTQQ